VARVYITPVDVRLWELEVERIVAGGEVWLQPVTLDWLVEQTYNGEPDLRYPSRHWGWSRERFVEYYTQRGALWPSLSQAEWAECFVHSGYSTGREFEVLVVAYDGIFGYFSMVFQVDLEQIGPLDWGGVVECWRREMSKEIMKCYEPASWREHQRLARVVNMGYREHLNCRCYVVPFGEYEFRVFTSENFPPGWVASGI